MIKNDIKYMNIMVEGVDAGMFPDNYYDDIATEAASTVMNVNGEPMKIFICTDKIIMENNLKPVTNPTPFTNIAANITSPDGLYSEEIFGYTQDEKNLNHGYIELHRKFFHPYVFEILCGLHSKVKEIAMRGGEKFYTIKEGKYVEVTDETDPAFDPNNTGLDYVIRSFRQLAYTKNDSRKHNDDVDFITSLSDDEALISKYLIIPRSYRDYSSQGRMKSVDPVNNLYSALIKNANSLREGIAGYVSHKTMNRIQQDLVALRQYGQKLLEKKEGHIHKGVLGKSTTYGVRGVISVPSLVGCDFPDDCQVDIVTSGMPLGMCIQAGYPFIIKWLVDWVERNLYGGSIMVYRPSEKDPSKGEQVEVKIKNHVEIFDTKYLHKKLSQFVKGYGGRWKPIEVELEDGSTTYIAFTGRSYASHTDKPGAATISNRPLTWCDLFYMAAEDTLSNKHVYSTRYPAEDYFNVNATRVSVLSTIKTMPMMVNGKVYKHYPVIDPFESEMNVARAFINTIAVSNLLLEGFGGDYDGDTVSSKMMFSEEANQEAEDLIFSISNYMTIGGSLIRVVGKEATLCMYNMTRRA